MNKNNEDPVFLGYEGASRDNDYPTFRTNAMPLSARVSEFRQER